MKKLLFCLVLALFTAFAVISGTVLTEKPLVAQEVMSLLTAGKNSFYYQAATELKDSLKGTGFTLNIQESSGSSQNLESLGSGKAELAFAQQDALLLLKNLTDQNLAKLAENIKIFAPINNEVIHIITNSSSGINSFADLVGKRVAVGPENSGTYVSAILLYQLNDIDVTEANLSTIEIKEAIEKVRNGQLDAAFYTASVGAPLLKEISAQKGSTLKLLSIDQQSFKNSNQYFKDNAVLYLPTKIPAKTYPWQNQDINTVSTFSFLYVKNSLDTQTVYNLAKAAYPKAAALKAKNTFWQAFGVAEAKRQVAAGYDYHPGVKQFLQGS